MNIQCVDLFTGMTLVGDLQGQEQDHFNLQSAMAVALAPTPQGVAMDLGPMTLPWAMFNRKDTRNVKIPKILVIGEPYSPPADLQNLYTQKSIGIVIAPGR